MSCQNEFTRVQEIGQNGRDIFLEHAGHSAIAQQFYEALRAG